MSAILHCYVDDATHQALWAASHATGRTVEDLAEAAIANAAVDHANRQPAPPQTGQLALVAPFLRNGRLVARDDEAD